jgi:zinc transport system ATP-binding protein
MIEDLSLEVPAGDSLAIIGPNASGKTVLLRALIGSVRHEGTVRWASGTRIGYVPQRLGLERDLPLTGLDLLRARARLAGADRERTREALAAIGLPEDAARQTIGTLSAGQLQRLLLALALLGEPTVLLVDEPTAGVDEPGQEGIAALLDRLRRDRGLTLLIVTHELSLVYRLGRRVLCLARRRAWLGRPVEILTPERLEEVYGAPVDFHVHGGPGA